MVVDTSALIAVLQSEHGAERLARALHRAPVLRISAVAMVEASIVLLPRLGEAGVLRLDALLKELAIEVVPVTRATAELARDAFRRYGKGRHPAALNFGDCFSFALAMERGETLLFVGDDFSRTDVPPAAY
jgi:ribonuclease VapC